ncbi:MAG: DUF1614 domain-containing protein [Methanocorpusculum sp.]|nr:DUF1614 domain-containing protein [Methanocorpusculum sp.]
MSRLIFSPISIWLLLALVLLVIIGLPLLFFGLIGAALANLGFGFWAIVLLIIAVIAGSFVNLPLGSIRPRIHASDEAAPSRKPRGQYAPSMYDKMYRTERFDVDAPSAAEQSRGTQICINIGGAVIPVLIALYVIISAASGNISHDAWYLLKMAGAVALVSLTAFLTAKPVKGIGIAAPFFAAPLVSIISGLVLGGGFGIAAAGIAFVSGTLGTLIGADLLHLRDVADNDTPMLSIGGAGTFDGIFLTGIITALLASF